MNINSSLSKTPIAVVGMSALFADAKNLEEYWNNIIQSVDSIKDVPDTRWSIDDYYDPDPSVPDKTYCKKGGFIPDLDFNPMEYGLPPNILEVTDASQLLALIAARDAFEHAGYGKSSARFTKELKEKTGVLMGVGGGQKLITPLTSRLQYPIWERALRASGIAEEDIPPIVDKMKKAYIGWNENSFPGMLGNVISGRITNRFDLGGINSVVDAACAASLSAIKMSLSELVEGRADMMLTGGVDTDNSPFMYMSFSKTPAFSKSNKISPFSDTADGMIIGEGVGMLVLKRLADAERDGDTVYAVIKGVGTSSDGRFKSVYAPRPSGQALAMERAYQDANYPANTVGLLEAHGTGTGAGDPTEFTSMNMVFSKDKPKQPHIALGSVKSQVGHTKAAAGAAGMIKAVLALHHKILPATINVTKPNSKFDLKDSAIYINTETRPWIATDTPRRASCSAFGFGGINVHIALEEYNPQPKNKDYRLHQPYQAILLASANASTLLQEAKEWRTKLASANAPTAFHELLEQSKTTKPTAAQARLGFVANGLTNTTELLDITIAQLEQNQQAWEHPKGIYYRPQAMNTNGKVVALFAGQGSQYVGMAKELVNAFPSMRHTLEQTNKTIQQQGRPALTDSIYPQPVFDEVAAKQLQTNLTQTQNAQPAIGAISMAMYEVLKEAGFEANFVAGHSFGELTALWAAGAYDKATFLALAKARGEAMATQNPNADSGTMLAVKSDFTQVKAAIEGMQGVQIANVNSDKQIILGGSKNAIAQAMQQLKAKGFAVVPLSVSAAFHTPLVAHAQAPFAQFVAQQSFQSPRIPVYANSTAKRYSQDINDIKQTLQGQILNPVWWKHQVEQMYADGGRIFVEFGPKNILTNLVKTILNGREHTAIALNANAKKDSDYQFRQAVLQLQVLGLPLGNVDTYAAPKAAPVPVSKMNVSLSGYNYVSKPTQKAYQDALNDGHKISYGNAEPKIIEKIIEKPVIKEVERIVEKIIEVPATATTISSSNLEDEAMNKELLETLKHTVEHITTQQTKSLEIFQNFLQEQSKQSQLLLQLMTQQVGQTETNTTSQPQTVTAPTNSQPQTAMDTSNHVPTPQPIVEPMLAVANVELQNDYATTIPTSVIEPKTATIPTSVAAPVQTAVQQTGGLSQTRIEAILLEVVSEKTGYPAEMLELSMDMEADLGIDSIKRVEIFGAMTEDYPEVQGVNPNELTELRTLGQIVDYLMSKSGNTTAPTSVATPVQQPVQNINNNVSQNIATPATGGLSQTRIEAILLEVVSEKTGYPAEMLELSMDMEADLGIDSIKRVEIFGAMTEDYPEVQGVNPNELTELRTLGQIVDYLMSKSGNATAPTSIATPVQHANNNVSQVAAPANEGGLSQARIEAILLEVVSEKTGYPAEMLELSMDMEADLGIDSIKRVEIFGAMTEDYPEVQGVNPNELTELRTLGQIVDYLMSKSKKKALV